MFKKLSNILFTTLLCLVCTAQSAMADDEVVNIYSARKEALILPVLEQFREQTGIDFKLITGKADALLKRIELEGEATPADLFITVDAGRLYRAKQANALQQLGAIPSMQWFRKICETGMTTGSAFHNEREP